MIGEVEPLDSYQITHGICAACRPDAVTYEDTAQMRRVQRIYSELLHAARNGHLDEAAGCIRRAIEENVKPVELMLGLLQPALCQIGSLWEDGTISVADEHRFTAVVEHAIAVLPAPPPLPADSPRVLLLLTNGNVHEIGVRMLAAMATEYHVRCDIVIPGIPDDVAVDLCRREKPDLVGLSVSLASQVAVADALASHLHTELGIDVILGGGVFRREKKLEPTATRVVPTIDAFREEMVSLTRRPRPA